MTIIYRYFLEFKIEASMVNVEALSRDDADMALAARYPDARASYMRNIDDATLIDLRSARAEAAHLRREIGVAF